MDKENLKLKSKEAQLRVLSQVLTASERDGAIESLPDDPDALEETNANESSAAKVRQGCLLQWLCWGVFFFFFLFVCLVGWLVGWLVGLGHQCLPAKETNGEHSIIIWWRFHAVHGIIQPGSACTTSTIQEEVQ